MPRKNKIVAESIIVETENISTDTTCNPNGTNETIIPESMMVTDAPESIIITTSADLPVPKPIAPPPPKLESHRPSHVAGVTRRRL